MKRVITLFISILVLLAIIAYVSLNIMNKKDVYLTQDIDVSTMSQLAIVSKSLDVEIQPTDNEQLTIRIVGKAKKSYVENLKIDAKTQGDLLALSYKMGDEKWPFTSGISNASLKLQILIPSKDWAKIIVEASSGNINAEALESTKINFKSTSGNIKMTNTTADQLTFESTSGLQDIDNTAADVLHLTSTSGTIEGDHLNAQQFTANSTSGDKIINNITANAIDINSTSGSNSLHISDGEKAQFMSTSGDTVVQTEELLSDISAESTSGDFELHVNRKIDNLRIHSSQTSGDQQFDIKGLNSKQSTNSIGAATNKLNVKTTSGDFILSEI